jgi:hypothetical protein
MEFKKLIKKWWFWVLIIFVGIPFMVGVFEGIGDIATGNVSTNTSIENTINNTITETSKEAYTLKGGEIGAYGKKVTLNANTDMPVDKYLYKLPAGKYKITTDNKKTTSFFIVKDNITKNQNEKYPEELNIVKSYLITNSDNVEIELKNDESIQIVDNDSITLTK